MIPRKPRLRTRAQAVGPSHSGFVPRATLPTIPDSYIENYNGHYKQEGSVHSEQQSRLFLFMVCYNPHYF